MPPFDGMLSLSKHKPAENLKALLMQRHTHIRVRMQ